MSKPARPSRKRTFRVASATLRRSKQLTTGLAFLSPLLLGSVCGKPCGSSAGGPCVTRLPEGGEVYVTVLERWDENSTLLDPRRPSAIPGCDTLAFRNGDRVALRVAGVTDGRLPTGTNCEDCQTRFAHAVQLTAGARRFEPTPIMWQEWDLDSAYPIESWDHVVIDSGCEGTLIISFGLHNTDGGDPLARGYGPLYRFFIPDQGSCPNRPMAEGTPGGPPPFDVDIALPPGCQDFYIVTALDAPPPDWPAELGAPGPGVDGGSANADAGGGSLE